MIFFTGMIAYLALTLQLSANFTCHLVLSRRLREQLKAMLTGQTPPLPSAPVVVLCTLQAKTEK